MAFNLVFASNTILLFFLSVIDLYFLILAVIAHIFIVATKLAIATEIPTRKKKKTEIETHPVAEEAKITKWTV